MKYTLKPFPDKNSIAELSEKAAVSPVTAALLLQRGVSTPESAEEFLAPKSHGDPLLLPDAEKGADILIEARKNKSRVMIFGDYDVDGMATTALLYKALKSLGFDAGYRLPDRLNDGYDITPEAVREMAEEGCGVILTCDCGSRAVEAVRLAKSLGLAVIVTDHHQPGDSPSAPDALINPHREDSKYPYPYLCGAGVAYRFIHALLLRMGVKPDSFLKKYADLVCLATVADVVPLTGENRLLVKQGIGYLKNPVSARKGIKALIENSRPDTVSCHYLSFYIIPLLNSASRMGQAETAMALLMETDAEKAAQKLSDLTRLNNTRKKNEDEGFAAASLEVYKNGWDTSDVLVVKGGWLHSISGNIASRLCKAFNRPAIAIGKEGANGLCIGSARNNNAVDILALLSDCSGILERYGGHKAAGGLTIKAENVDLLRDEINKAYLRKYKRGAEKPATEVDIALGKKCFSVENGLRLFGEIERLEPFGEANPRPLFLTKRIKVNKAEAFKNMKHLRLELGESPFNIEAVFWNNGEMAAKLREGMLVDIIYSAEIHSFRERRPRLILEALTPSVAGEN